jgi:outer membrane biosynthesis protein TonB
MMRWNVVVAVVVTGVAASSPVGAQIANRDSVWVTATARTRISLSPDGPWIAQPAQPGATLEVHDHTGHRLQILDEVNGAKLVFYVDPATLQTVTRDSVRLVPSAAAAGHSDDDDGPGMMLDAGTPIDASQPAPGGLLKVRVHGRWNSDLKVTGYIPASQVGIEYPRGGGLSLMQSADVSLPVRFQLLDAPHGSPFVVSANPKRVPGKLIKREGGAALVRISEGAVGWIASSQLRPVPESAHESIGMAVAVRMDLTCEHYDASDPEQAARCGPDPENTLAVGAHLFDAPGGRWVGVVTPYFRSPPLRQDRGWTRFEVVTQYGKIGLWAQPGALAEAATQRASAPPHPPMPEPGNFDPKDFEVVAAPPPPADPVEVGFGEPSGDFGGLTADEITLVVRVRAGVFRACYQRELNHTPGIGGKLIIHFKIGGDGAVQRDSPIATSGSTLRNDAVEQCVKANVSRLRFPAKGGVASLSYPFVFTTTGMTPTPTAAPGAAGAAPEAVTPAAPATPDLPDSLDRAMIFDGMDKLKPQVMSCAEKWPARGQVKVSVTVGPDGHVLSVTVKTTPDAGLGSCVASVVQKATFARTRNGGSFGYPYTF